MIKETVYVIHKNGVCSHHLGLKYLLHKNHIALEYREFSIFSKLFRSIAKGKLGLAKKQVVNLLFFISLLFSKNKKVVLGIAPYDIKLAVLLFFLKTHSVYYHTSWTCWDKSFQPKKIKSQKILRIWKFFLEKKVKHIFAVTNVSKQAILSNYRVSEKSISVVFHSIDSAFSKQNSTQKTKNSFVYYGRLVRQKGIDELLAFFKEYQKATITFIGDGKETEKIRKVSKEYKNIALLPYLRNKKELQKVIASFQYLIMNSIKTSKWEELFGMAIIEGMSQGLIPIATNHSGPKEIISLETGYLCDEGGMSAALKNIIMTNPNNQKKVENCKKTASEYTINKISEKWKAIL